MKYLLFSLLCFLTLSLTAQEACPNTYDGNADGSVTINDLLDLLGVFGDSDTDSDGIWDSIDDCIDLTACNYANDPTEACNYIDALGNCGGGCEGDSDNDGICDSEDDCVGVLDECGVCNGPGATEVVIESITLLYDSVYLPQLEEWYVYDFGADTTFTYWCPSTLTPLTDDNIHVAVWVWISDEVQAEDTYGHISDWDVSSVTDMNHMFWNAYNFNGDISSWDVSSVTDMNHMFWNAYNFNGDISSWDVSSVTDMSSMFSVTESFNGDLSSWDVSSVTNMNRMFANTVAFNGDLSSWDVSSVTNMNWMFTNTPDFNGDLSTWDVSSVTDMSSMFNGASSFNGDISAWDVSSVTNMNSMFSLAYDFNGDLSTWDVSSVTDMGEMFEYTGWFNSDLSSWDVSSVTNMSGMFANTYYFNGDISAWDVSSVTNMGGMFASAGFLSEENQCLIHTSFSSNSNWPYDWSGFCPFVCGDLVSHEGYNYSTVQIGNQCWFSENCRYLPVVSPSNEGSTTAPYFYVLGYEGTDVAAAKATSNYGTYGVLYNWPAVMTEGICPSGWHIPSDGEWQTMEISLGMSEEEAASTWWRGSPVGDYLKSTYGWNNNGNGSNSSGFSGLPGRHRSSSGGFNTYDSAGFWWSSTGSGSNSWMRHLNNVQAYVYRNNYDRNNGFSARCVRD
jgi:uncharacterized protein (TIGR02145 family)